MKEAEVLAPVEVALKIYQHIIQSVFRPHMRSSDKQRTLDTLPSTFLIFAKIILPIKINPIILDQTATSRSRCKISTRRLSSEVTRSIPPCLVVPSSRGGNSAAPWCRCEYPKNKLTQAYGVSSRSAIIRFKLKHIERRTMNTLQTQYTLSAHPAANHKRPLKLLPISLISFLFFNTATSAIICPSIAFRLANSRSRLARWAAAGVLEVQRDKIDCAADAAASRAADEVAKLRDRVRWDISIRAL